MLKALIFAKVCLKLSYFSKKKTAKSLSAWGSAPRPPNLRQQGALLQTPLSPAARRITPDPRYSPPLQIFGYAPRQTNSQYSIQKFYLE